MHGCGRLAEILAVADIEKQFDGFDIHELFHVAFIAITNCEYITFSN